MKRPPQYTILQLTTSHSAARLSATTMNKVSPLSYLILATDGNTS